MSAASAHQRHGWKVVASECRAGAQSWRCHGRLPSAWRAQHSSRNRGCL